MKKKETVEVQYVKKTTTLIAALICLAVGFFLGVVYKNFDGGSSGKVRKMTVRQHQQSPQSPQSAGPSAQQTAALLKWKQEVTANPKNAEAWSMLGHTYFDMNQYQDAIDAYKKHLELKPGNADVLTDMGVMYRRTGNPREAVRCFDKAIQSSPRHEQSRFNKGIVLMHDLDNPKAALEAWRELVKINPSAKAPGGISIKELIKKFKN